LVAAACGFPKDALVYPSHSPKQVKDHNRPLIIFGPLPPPYGGIASIVEALQLADFDDLSIRIVRTTLTDKRLFFRLIIGARMLWRVATSTLKYRPDGALCFASAFASVWEKIVWASVVRLFGGRTAVVMVDGNFPRFEEALRPFTRRMLRRCLSRFDIIGVQSEGWLEYYRRLSPGSNYSLVVGGVDTDAFSPAVTSRTNAAVFRIIYVGWMIEEKGIYDLIAAAGKLRNHPRTLQLKLIGPCFDQEARLRQAIADARLEPLVEVLGPVGPRKELIGQYQAADLFVLPSYAEGFPNSLLEAMAVGLPVVATNVGGIPEIVDDGITGTLVPPRDADALAAAIATLMDDEQTRLTMSAAGRSKALANYTLSHSFDSYRRLILLLTAESAGNQEADDRLISKQKCAE